VISQQNSKLEWVANDWRKLDFPAVFGLGQTQQEAMISLQNWRSQFVEGEPKATEKYSVADLKAMGIIGLYKRVEEK